jgi:hypothetical protein
MIHIKLLLVSLIFLTSGVIYTQQTVGFQLNTPQSYDGYTLFSPTPYTNTYLIDNCGYLINSWETDNNPGSLAYLLEDGSLLRPESIPTTFNAGGSGGRLVKLDWNSNIIWSYDYSSALVQQHHDVEIMPNGNILVLAWELKSESEAIAQGRDPNLVTNNGLWPEHIVEIQPVGSNGINIVWEWYSWNHLIQDFNSSAPNFGVIADHPEKIDLNFAPTTSADWIHANAISYNPGLDQIMINSRNFHEFWIIDHSTTTAEAAGNTGGNSGMGGEILYRWGNPQTYDRGDNSNQQFFGQHDAHWIPDFLPDGGNIMVFNNGNGRPGGNYSSVDVLTPPLSGSNYLINTGQPFGPTNLLSSYVGTPTSSFYSPKISGAQRQSNGNTLICEGGSGTLFEVDVAGNIVWKYINPVGLFGPVPQGSSPPNNEVFRAYRYDASYSGLAGQDLTPGNPIETAPQPYSCTIGGSTILTVTCPSAINVETTNGQTSIPVNWSPATGSTTCNDNTVNITQISGQPSGSNFDIGTHNISYQATDNCGNIEACTFTITVELGNTTLTIDCPTNQSYFVSSDATGAIANWSAPITTSNCPTGTITIQQIGGQPNGTEFPIGLSQVVFEAQDGCSNSENCSFFIDVIPTQLFVACPANQVIYIANDESSAVANWIEPNSNSNCPTGNAIAIQTTGLLNGTDFPIGNTTNSYTANDDCENEEYCNFSIEVISTTLTLNCPENITNYLPEDTISSVVNWTDPIAITDCFPQMTNFIQTTGGANGSSFALGISSIGYEATDACGNLATCSFDIETIETNMDLTCPASQTIYIDENQNAAIATWNSPILNTSCPLGMPDLTQIQGSTSGSNFPIGNTTIAYQATDDCSNLENCTFSIKVIQTNLSLTCPSNQTIYLPTDSTTAMVEWMLPLANTDCPLNNLMLSQIQGNSSGSSFGLGIATIIYQATDDCDNDENCSFDIEIIETNFELVCPANILITVVTGTTNTMVNWDLPTLTGDCPINTPTLQQTQGMPSGSSFDLGVSVIGYMAIDDCGNTLDCSFEIEIVETNLSLNCPNDVVVFTDNNGTAQVVNWNIPTVNSTCNTGQINLEQTVGISNGSTFPEGLTVITYEATDDCDNVETCSFNVEIIATNLLLNCQTDTIISLAENEEGVIYNFDNPIPIGSCPGDLITNQTTGVPSGTFLETGSYLNSFSVTDTCQNEATCSYQITIENTALTITCPENITMSIPQGNSSEVVNWDDPILMSSCPNGDITFDLTSNMPSGSNFPAGNSLVNYSATDDCGNMVDCQFSILLEETNISLFCPSDTTIFVAENNTEAIVEWIVPTGSSDCVQGNFQINQISGLVNGSSFPLGVNLIDFMATDDCENNLSCSFQIEIIATSLILTCPEDMTFFIAQNEMTGVANWDLPIVNGTCPINLSLEEINGQNSGDSFPTGSSIIIYSATDDCGNQQSCNFQVEVINTNLLLNCPENITTYLTMSTPGLIVDFDAAIGTTSCPDGGLTIEQTAGLASGSEFPVGLLPVTYTAMDNCGNVTECSFDVEVIATAIAVDCLEEVTVYIPEGDVTGIASWQIPTGTSSCPEANLLINQTEGMIPGSIFPLGTSMVSYELTDDCQNTAICTFFVTVESILLTIDCPDDIIIQIANGDPNPEVNWSLISAATSCEEGILDVIQIAGLQSGSEFPMDTTQIVYQAIDGCGIEQLCSFSVIVEIVSTDKEIVNNSEISISPNPANDQIYLKIRHETLSEGTMEIYRVDGQILKSIPIPSFQKEMVLATDISDFRNESYLMKIHFPNEKPVWKQFIIVR